MKVKVYIGLAPFCSASLSQPTKSKNKNQWGPVFLAFFCSQGGFIDFTLVSLWLLVILFKTILLYNIMAVLISVVCDSHSQSALLVGLSD